MPSQDAPALDISQTPSDDAADPMQDTPESSSQRPANPKKRKRAQMSRGPPKDIPANKVHDREYVKQYLDDRYGEVFELVTMPQETMKTFRKNQKAQFFKSPFNRSLDSHYWVKPANLWFDSLKKYQKFTVGDPDLGHQVQIGACDFVYVKHTEPTPATDDITPVDVSEQWKAMVIDIRALSGDGEHVFLLVSWLNRPEDMPDGRQPYHGKNELIPTNHLDIIDAMSVNGKFEMVQWPEDIDAPAPDGDQFYWRYSWDKTYTNQISELKPICIERAPYNPDELIVQCSQKGCKKWMHGKCLPLEAIKRAKDQKKRARPSAVASLFGIGSRDISIPSEATQTVEATLDGWSATLYLRDTLADPTDDVKPSTIVVTDPSGNKESTPATCLLCEAVIA